jgi:DNA-directed RNA polymerase specialized sigma24 family protein
MMFGPQFRETRWTQVRRAKLDSPEGQRALSELCAAYYEPVTAFLRSTLPDPDSALELSHAFFARLMAGGAIAHASEDQGRFRSYLLGALKHFVARQREAEGRLKRGAAIEHLSTDASPDGRPPLALPDPGQLSPDEAYDRQWALTVLRRAMESLQQECFREGRGEFFDEAKPWLTGEAGHGDQKDLARRIGMNETALKVAIHRLRRRFRDWLRAEIAATLEHPEWIESELQALFAALERKSMNPGNPSPVPRQETDA